MKKKNETFFVKQLKRLLLEKGITQQDLAKKLKVTKSYVSIYLNGKQDPKPATVYKIAKALEVQPAFFYDDGQSNFIDNSGTIGAIGNNNSSNIHMNNSEFLQEKTKRLELEIEILKNRIEKLEKENVELKLKTKELEDRIKLLEKK